MDPQTAGRELRVADVLTGHFQKEGDQLRVTLEVVDTESNRLLWRDTLERRRRAISSACASRSRRACGRGSSRCSAARRAAADAATRPKNAGGLRPLSSQQALHERPRAEQAGASRCSSAPSDSTPTTRRPGRPCPGGITSRPRSETPGRMLRPFGIRSPRRPWRSTPTSPKPRCGSIVLSTGARPARSRPTRRPADLVRRRPRGSRGALQSRLRASLRGPARRERAGNARPRARWIPRIEAFRSCGFLFMQTGDYARARDYTASRCGLGLGAERRGRHPAARGQAREPRWRWSRPRGRARPGFGHARERPGAGTRPTRRRRTRRGRWPTGSGEQVLRQRATSRWRAIGEAALRLLRKAVENGYLVPRGDG